ncbi:MAG: hypothetical protein ACREC0_08925 [Methylocella sp.]
MSRLVFLLQPLLGSGVARVALYSGLLVPGGNIPVAFLVTAVLRFSARGDRNPARAN